MSHLVVVFTKHKVSVFSNLHICRQNQHKDMFCDPLRLRMPGIADNKIDYPAADLKKLIFCK